MPTKIYSIDASIATTTVNKYNDMHFVYCKVYSKCAMLLVQVYNAIVLSHHIPPKNHITT